MISNCRRIGSCMLFAFLLGTNFACTNSANPIAATAPIKIPQTQPSAAAVDVMKRAAAVQDVLEDRRANGEPLTFAFVDSYLTWNRRMAEARCDVATTKAERIAIIQQYIRRIRTSVPVVEFGNMPHPQVEMMEYYLAEANVRLERVENEK